MQTKFILYGGFNPSEEVPDNTAFSSEIMKDAPEGARILVVPFAKEADRIIPTLERVSAELESAQWQKNITIEGATEENFMQQISSADVIYFQGGSSSKLLETLKKYSGLSEALQGKVVAGDSGGGNVLCNFFYSPSKNKIIRGLGILPVKMIPHFKEEYRNKFDNTHPEITELLLREHEYKIIYK